MMRITKTGMVNCRTMALPAVVILLEREYRMLVAEMEREAMITVGLTVNLCFRVFRKRKMQMAARMDLALPMARAPQGMILKNNPPSAKNSEDSKTKNVA